MGWSRDRCCVAIPLYNVGVYAILAQFAVISIVTAVLSFAAPYIVAVSIPSFGAYLLGGICCVLFGLQGWGFFGVYKEKPATFRKYVAVNTIVLLLAFVMALVWIIVSVVKHNTAVTACIAQFITETEGSGVTSSGSVSEVNVTQGSVSGSTLCSIFTWVQTGIMGGLWLALLIIESYFAIVSRIYGSEQREDHRRYNSVYTEARHSIMRQSMMWENGRLSSDGEPLPPAGLPGHNRQTSRLRNEVKGDEDEEDEEKQIQPGDYSVGNTTAGEGYVDAPLFTSPTKGQQQQHQPYGVNAYSHTYTNSRSNLAPVDSNPAYTTANNSAYGHQEDHARYQNHGARPYRGTQTYDQGGRYDHDAAEDFTGYYAR